MNTARSCVTTLETEVFLCYQNEYKKTKREREKARYQITHTESKQGAKTYRWRFASQYFTNTSLVNEIDNQSAFLSEPAETHPDNPKSPSVQATENHLF